VKLGKKAGLELLRELLVAHPNIRRLDLLDTLIPSSDLAALLSSDPKLFYHVESIVHPLFLLQWNAQRCSDAWRSAFTVSTDGSNNYNGNPCVSLPFLNSAQVMKALSNLVRILSSEDYLVRSSFILSEHVIHATTPVASRPDGRPWLDRDVLMFPKESFGGFLGEGWVFFSTTPSILSDAGQWGFVRVSRKALLQAAEQSAEKPASKGLLDLLETSKAKFESSGQCRVPLPVIFSVIANNSADPTSRHAFW
jgi:hypothetical protein